MDLNRLSIFGIDFVSDVNCWAVLRKYRENVNVVPHENLIPDFNHFSIAFLMANRRKISADNGLQWPPRLLSSCENEVVLHAP